MAIIEDQATQVIDMKSINQQSENDGTTIHIHLNNYGQINLSQNNGFALYHSEEKLLEWELEMKLSRLIRIKHQRKIDEIEDRIRQLETELGIQT